MHNRIILPTNEKELLYISYTRIDAQFKASFHSHPNLELLWFQSGNGYIKTSNKNIKVKKGDLIIINPHAMHCEIADDDLSFYAIGIHQLNIFIKETFSKKIIHFPLQIQDEKMIDAIYNYIYQEALKKDMNYMLLIKNLLDTLLLILNKNNLYLYMNNTIDHSSLVSNVINILDNYYYLKIKLEEIAHRLSSSTSLICHEFKKEMGISVMEYKLRKQFEEAKNLLTISDMSIAEIASATGFLNPSYFSQKFKERFYETPIQFKEKNGINQNNVKKLQLNEN